jgi:peptide/nickel transport system substrate-binding protein
MRRRDILTSAASAAIIGGSGPGRPSIARPAMSTLRFVPYVNLTSLDPVWTVTGATLAYGYMVYDMLYGIDDRFEPRPQMCAGHEVSSDGLTWTFTLRDGLLFHDNEKVRAIDCVASLARWSVRDPFGQQIAALTEEVKPLDDRRFRIRLKRPFPQMLFALGARACFIMPERVAKASAMEQIKESIGSGPYRFLAKEWVSGASAAWEKFDEYVPRPEPPSNLSGGKLVNFERVEWVVQPDSATAAAALRTGEVDWLEMPLIDLVPMLRTAGGITVKPVNPWGQLCVLAFNHLWPPFDNPKLLRALLPAVDQKAFIQAVVGEQAEFGHYPAGYFTEGTPMATRAGLEVLSGPRDIPLAKKLVAESGYKGEPILLMSPTDFPMHGQLGQMTRGLFQELGLNVDFVEMDFGSEVVRRQNTSPPAKGGWNCAPQTWTVLNASNPGNSQALRSNGNAGTFGWATDETLEALRQQWFDAADLMEQRAICEQIQRRAFETIPQLPLGRVFAPGAFRDNVIGIVQAPYPVFWGAKKV